MIATIQTHKIARVGEDVEKSESLCIAGGHEKWCSCCRRILWCLKKLNIEIPYNPAIPLLGVHLKELKAGLEKIFAHHIYSSIIHNSQKMGTIQMSIN